MTLALGAVGIGIFAGAVRALAGALYLLSSAKAAVGILKALGRGGKWTAGALGILDVASDVAGDVPGRKGAGATPKGTPAVPRVTPLPNVPPAVPAGTGITVAEGVAATGTLGASLVAAGVLAGGAMATVFSKQVLDTMDQAQRSSLSDNPVLGALAGDLALAAAIVSVDPEAAPAPDPWGEKVAGFIKSFHLPSDPNEGLTDEQARFARQQLELDAPAPRPREYEGKPTDELPGKRADDREGRVRVIPYSHLDLDHPVDPLAGFFAQVSRFSADWNRALLGLPVPVANRPADQEDREDQRSSGWDQFWSQFRARNREMLDLSIDREREKRQEIRLPDVAAPDTAGSAHSGFHASMKALADRLPQPGAVQKVELVGGLFEPIGAYGDWQAPVYEPPRTRGGDSDVRPMPDSRTPNEGRDARQPQPDERRGFGLDALRQSLAGLPRQGEVPRVRVVNDLLRPLGELPRPQIDDWPARTKGGYSDVRPMPDSKTPCAPAEVAPSAPAVAPQSLDFGRVRQSIDALASSLLGMRPIAESIRQASEPAGNDEVAINRLPPITFAGIPTVNAPPSGTQQVQVMNPVRPNVSVSVSVSLTQTSASAQAIGAAVGAEVSAAVEGHFGDGGL